jgi:hypothetical protein
VSDRGVSSVSYWWQDIATEIVTMASAMDVGDEEIELPTSSSGKGEMKRFEVKKWNYGKWHNCPPQCPTPTKQQLCGLGTLWWTIVLFALIT